MNAPAPPTKNMGFVYAALFFVGAGAVVTERAFHMAPIPGALVCFGGVVAAALLISWGAEAAQFHVSRGLAIAAIAFLQVLPEFMVEATIAWKRDIPLMFANATGSSRILIGVGWPLVFFAADISSRLQGKGRIKHVSLPQENLLDVLLLLLASAYYIVLLVKQTLSLVDTFILGGMFLGYLELLRRMPKQDSSEKEELLAPPRALVDISSGKKKAAAIIGIFIFGGLVMALVAEPFVESMRRLAGSFGISAFVFVQWMAPFLSEFPEKVTAFYWAKTIRLAPMALLNLVASTVNQYTALVAMIPLVYCLSLGEMSAVVPMVGHHRAEMLLSFAMTLYGCTCLFKLRFTRKNAWTLFAIWVVQFSYQRQLPISLPVLGNNPHTVLSLVLMLFAAFEVARHRREIHISSAFKKVRNLFAAASASETTAALGQGGDAHLPGQSSKSASTSEH